MIIAAVLITGLMMVWLSRRCVGDLASPVSVYAIAWCLLIVLYHLDMVSYDPVRRENLAGHFFECGCVSLGRLERFVGLSNR